MKWLAVIVALMMLAAAPATDEAVRFTTVDIRIDPAGKPLAAYQVEFVADASRVKLVGIEGGDAAPFAPDTTHGSRLSPTSAPRTTGLAGCPTCSGPSRRASRAKAIARRGTNRAATPWRC